jgi:hypothetical protein
MGLFSAFLVHPLPGRGNASAGSEVEGINCKNERRVCVRLTTGDQFLVLSDAGGKLEPCPKPSNIYDDEESGATVAKPLPFSPDLRDHAGGARHRMPEQDEPLNARVPDRARHVLHRSCGPFIRE